MSLPYTFAGMTTPELGYLDADLAALGALTTIPCVIAGGNALVLTPVANAPAVPSYSQDQAYSGIAGITNTGPVVAQVVSLASLPVYKDTPLGPVALAGNEVAAGNFVALAYDVALNAGSGGFHLVASYSLPGGRSQSSAAAPTAPASTSAFAMQGLAGSVAPIRSGVVLVIISGTIVSPAGTTAGLGIKYQISYGTGAPPVNAAAITGTQAGTVQQYTNAGTVTAADVSVPFSIQAIVSGLALGTSYWLDLAAESVGTASDMGLSNISVSALEQ